MTLLAAGPLDGLQVRVTSADGTVSALVPDSWVPLELNDVAVLELGNEEEEAYFVVLTDLTDDLYGWNLARHSHITLGQLLSTIDFPEVSGPIHKSIAGCEAVEYEIRGVGSGYRVIYLHTTIESEGLFAQVLVWTLPSRWDALESTLRNVVESIELAPGC